MKMIFIIAWPNNIIWWTFLGLRWVFFHKIYKVHAVNNQYSKEYTLNIWKSKKEPYIVFRRNNTMTKWMTQHIFNGEPFTLGNLTNLMILHHNIFYACVPCSSSICLSTYTIILGKWILLSPPPNSYIAWTLID